MSPCWSMASFARPTTPAGGRPAGAPETAGRGGRRGERPAPGPADAPAVPQCRTGAHMPLPEPIEPPEGFQTSHEPVRVPDDPERPDWLVGADEGLAAEE